mmetsp:Transcript_101386/g.180242  ORF Transcript_101386/g.180242 Transcript_101386/m.180242 type:complete len:191 (-) Transcript_101386:30-602(-)
MAALRRLALRSPSVKLLGRTVVAQAGRGHGAVQALHDEVETRFQELSQGHPANVSTGQLVQMIFEVGAADVKTQGVGEVMNTLMEHGYYRQTHPQKRDSYGAAEPPMVGLQESKRWATMFFLQRLKKEEQGDTPSPAADFSKALRHGRGRGGNELTAPPCAAAWCQCPPGSAGTKNCVLFAQSQAQADRT